MAWECTLCGFTVTSVNPPRECPECGASQELLMWVQDEVADEEEEIYESDLYEEEEPNEDEEEPGQDRIPELGEELGVLPGSAEDDDFEE